MDLRAGAPSPSRLEAEHLAKTYGTRRVVQDVHLAVSAGEVVGLLGPNGAGKTTTFYMVVGLVRADEGRSASTASRSRACRSTARSRMGLSYLPQEASIFRKLNVEENIRAVLELQVGPDGTVAAGATIDANAGTAAAGPGHREAARFAGAGAVGR
jgi:lipopolysaccharide export system ATP-binding protein